jgi:hypothetical protein
MNARITSHYGSRSQPLPGASEFHAAIDLSAPMRTKFYAAYPGLIVAS